MTIDLGLSGNDLMVYAIIYGYSQDGTSMFKGSYRYISELIGSSRNTAIKSVKSLEEKNLIEVREDYHNGMKLLSYKCILSNCIGGAEIGTPHTNNCTRGSAEIGTPNKYINNSKEDIYTDEKQKSLFDGETPVGKHLKKGKEKSSAKKEKFDHSDFRHSLIEMGADEQHVDDWMTVRRKKGAVFTLSVLNALERECKASGKTISDAVRICAENGWQGFKASYVQEEKKEELNSKISF